MESWRKSYFKKGDVVPVGTVIAYLETEAAGNIEAPAANGDQKTTSAPVASVSPNGKGSAVEVANSVPVVAPVALKSRSESGRFYSPLVLNIARTEGLGMGELEQILGTGSNGRVTKKDILAYLKGPRIQSTVAAPAKTAPATLSGAPVPAGDYVLVKQKTYNHSGNIEIQEMDRMRKMIADNMVYSKHVSAHVTSFVEADVTHLVQWRNKNKQAFQEKYGEKITFTPIFLEALAQALREHPRINVSVDGDKVVLKKDINIGIAVALPNDNLIVPVIRNADRLNLVGLATAVNDLAARARINKLKPDELDGGTYTLSNVGTFGNVMGTPIIMQPQVAIMAAGAIRKKPAVIETPSGDLIGIRHQMFLSHSYDHRVVDGALGGRFVKRVAELLEGFDLERSI